MQPRLKALGEGWMVMEKPCGMSIHNTPGQDLISFASALLPEEAGKARPGKGAPFGLHPVHRIDAETSGLVLLAFHRDVFRSLSLQFENHQVEKEYLALVHGVPEERGHWAFPLSSRAEGRKNPQGTGHLQICETSYAVLRASERHALLRCSLRTGRTHQIRRHAALAGHPLAGDTRYAPTRALAFLKKNWPDMRLGLQAQKLSFKPPESASPLTLEIPDIPQAFMHLLAL
ncbi:RNA pseudouridine synthase [Desulfobotulus sp.]|uniref:RluA family pseudouridine synthase n=1 Tax=Desulfobotulus sp. TaxID=1940337 RepID=UPI002A371784|nr:RNA pseudouridine synthase [Desulfobotulus sp.]MDY0162014.1 RNA pseudouridine synthase [Desulfobotulus sp.]